MAVQQSQAEESTVDSEQPCITIYQESNQMRVPAEDVEELLRSVVYEMQNGHDDHEDTLIQLRPAEEFDPDGSNPFDTIN